MISKDWLERHANRCGLQPAQCVLGLPETQLSVIRWRRTEGNSEQVFTRDPLDGYIVSLHLQAMRADVWSGQRQIWSGSIGANTVRLILPGAKPRWVSDTSFDFLHLMFPRQTIDRISGADGDRVHRCLRRFAPLYYRDDVAVNLGRTLLEALRRKQPFAMPFAEAIGQALIAHLLGRYTGAPEGPMARYDLSQSALKRVREHVAANLNNDIRVRDLAAITGMSESRFAHGFRAATGTPPYRFVLAARLDEARARLGSNSGSILSIALDCGFKDASHFSRIFKRFIGCTPAAYRKSVGYGQQN